MATAVAEQPQSAERQNTKDQTNGTEGYPLDGSSRSTTHPPDHELKDVDFDKLFAEYASTINDLYSKTEEEYMEMLEEQDDILGPLIEKLLDTIRESYCPHYPTERLRAASACLFRIQDFISAKVGDKTDDEIGLDNEEFSNWIFFENKTVGKMWKERDPLMWEQIVDFHRSGKYPNLSYEYFVDYVQEIWEGDGNGEGDEAPRFPPKKDIHKTVRNAGGAGEADDDEEDEVDGEDGEDEEDQEEDEDEEEYEDSDEDEDEWGDDDDDDEDEYQEDNGEDEPPRKRVRL